MASLVQHSDNDATPAIAVVGVHIRTRRKLLGLSQRILSGKVGVTIAELREVERGHVRVPAWQLMLFAEALAVPVSFFYARARQPSEESPALPEKRKTKRETLQSIRAQYRLATPEERERLRRQAELLAQRRKGK